MNRFRAALAVAALLSASWALAAYPDRPVKLIVPWAAGGDTDSIYRAFQPHFQKHLGGTLVIANVGGASGTKGAKEAKDSPGDGYTIFAVHDSIHSTFHTGVADVNSTDFQPICLVASTPSIITASPKTPWADMKAMIADAKARPGQITVGATLGSTSHFFPAIVEKAAGVKFKYVSYEGTAPRMNALLGSHIELAESNLTQKGKVDAGQMKFLAIAADKRTPEAPNVPTLKEKGIDLEFTNWRGVVAPPGISEEDKQVWIDAFTRMHESASWKAELEEKGWVDAFATGEEFGTFLKEQDTEVAQILKTLGLA